MELIKDECYADVLNVYTEDKEDTIDVMKFIISLRKNLPNCTFKNDFILHEHLMKLATKVILENGDSFDLELETNQVKFKSKKRKWVSLSYEIAEDYILDYVRISDGSKNKKRLFFKNKK